MEGSREGGGVDRCGSEKFWGFWAGLCLKSTVSSIPFLVLGRIQLNQVMEREATSFIPMFVDSGVLL